MKRSKRGATRVRKNEQARKRTCGEKQKHRSKIEATGHKISLQMTGATRLQVYECKHCSAWHVGHKKQRKKAGGGR